MPCFLTHTLRNSQIGGIAESLYNLTAVTNDDRWAHASDRFQKKIFLRPLLERHDELRQLHANTHIPQVIAAARRYELTGDSRFRVIPQAAQRKLATIRRLFSGDVLMIAPLHLILPHRLAVGCDCTANLAADLQQDGSKRVCFLTARVTEPFAQGFARQLQACGIVTEILSGIEREPTIDMFHETVTHVRPFHADTVVGIGGGSVLDLAKLLAAFDISSPTLEETLGINLLVPHSTRIVCVPTTAGTGSEASPNAILLDEKTALKKAVISPHLIPNATYVDPRLMVGVPPKVTVATGIDAMTHCLEAFTNRFAHPMIDLYALEGVRLATAYVTRAVANGQDIEAREQMALASLYGGICLGPVNTAAVHALADPLGGEFHIPPGQSIALMLPHVFRFNARATPERYAQIRADPGRNATRRRSRDRTSRRRKTGRVDCRLRATSPPERLRRRGTVDSWAARKCDDGDALA
jgi:alcohol dehydrogenase class IV